MLPSSDGLRVVHVVMIGTIDVWGKPMFATVKLGIVWNSN